MGKTYQEGFCSKCQHCDEIKAKDAERRAVERRKRICMEFIACIMTDGNVTYWNANDDGVALAISALKHRGIEVASERTAGDAGNMVVERRYWIVAPEVKKE